MVRRDAFSDSVHLQSITKSRSMSFAIHLPIGENGGGDVGGGVSLMQEKKPVLRNKAMTK